MNKLTGIKNIIFDFGGVIAANAVSKGLKGLA